MSQYSKRKSQPSPETRAEAEQIARANQRPGQTKEQTRLIAQGIQKGIEQYKKQQKAKMREWDKQRKKAAGSAPENSPTVEEVEVVVYRQHWLPWLPWLPWLLLVLTWAGIGGYVIWSRLAV